MHFIDVPGGVGNKKNGNTPTEMDVMGDVSLHICMYVSMHTL